MQGGGVCIFESDCAGVSSDLFEATSDPAEQTGIMSNDPLVSPFANWTKVYLPYCTQDVFIGGGTTSNFPSITVQRFGAINMRAALRYVRDVLWREMDATTAEGYRPDRIRMLFGGTSAGGFGTLYNYHYVLDDLQWAHTAAWPDAALALDNGQVLGIANLGVILTSTTPPLGWGAKPYMPPYCFANNCGVGPVLYAASAPRLKAVPEQQFLVLSNQVDSTQVSTTYFPDLVTWINTMRQSYCEHDGNQRPALLPAGDHRQHARHLDAREPVHGQVRGRHPHEGLARHGDDRPRQPPRRGRGGNADDRLPGGQRVSLQHRLAAQAGADRLPERRRRGLAAQLARRRADQHPKPARRRVKPIRAPKPSGRIGYCRYCGAGVPPARGVGRRRAAAPAGKRTEARTTGVFRSRGGRSALLEETPGSP